MHARTFISSLDLFDKVLKVLAAEPGVPDSLKDLQAEMKAAFPSLRGVRDSVQHLEQRLQGEARGKALPAKPVDNPLVKAQSAVGIMNNLNGSKYGTVTEGGEYREVDVSPKSMERLQQILQNVLKSFSWKGPKTLSPNAGSAGFPLRKPDAV